MINVIKTFEKNLMFVVCLLNGKTQNNFLLEGMKMISYVFRLKNLV